ncbi:MAG: ATP-binding protein [Spirochaetota bacterium]|nr:ATP-binding protein [Spirochaetota bacterium]
MKQLLLLSGKGGTGKTTVATGLIQLSQAKAYADCDVDAPNLHLVLGTFDNHTTKPYYDLPKAVIDPIRCTECGLCYQVCRFDAIAENPYRVIPHLCEGCTFCTHVCPAGAIALEETVAGTIELHTRGDETFSTATLKMGSGTTGLLVTEVKKQIKDKAEFAILDGSPGIGCPVIASLTGVDLVLMVAEPSLSGISDLKRVIQNARQLQVPICVIVNKSDVNEELTERIRHYCAKEALPFLGTIPYDREAVAAINSGQSLIERGGPASEAIQEIYHKVMKELEAL